MGAVMRYFQRIGSVGSIARWAWRSSRILRSQNPELSEPEIAQALWQIRYGVSPPRPGSDEAVRLVAVSVDWLADLEELCMMVVFVEMDVSSRDGALYQDVAAVIASELKRLGYRGGA